MFYFARVASQAEIEEKRSPAEYKHFRPDPFFIFFMVLRGEKMFIRAAVAVFVLLFISSAFGEEQLGVAVFPGAKYDQARTKMLRKSLSAKGAAYRTSAPVAEVAAFYKKHGLLFLKIGSSSKEIARFKKVETDVDVVVQSPWRDAKTGAKMTDTLILIFKEEEKEKEKEKKSDVSI